jgi:hypothetical protein
MAGSPEGVLQVDDGTKGAVLTNVDGQPFTRIPVQPIFDDIGGGDRTVPKQGDQRYGEGLADGLGDLAQEGK